MNLELAIHGESGHHTPENSQGKFNTRSVLSFPLNFVILEDSAYIYKSFLLCFSS